MSTKITYGGDVITVIGKGTVVLNTSGKKLTGDIEILSTNEGGTNEPTDVDYWDGTLFIADGSIITFNIDDYIYQAEKGMNFNQWAQSDYNTGYDGGTIHMYYPSSAIYGYVLVTRDGKQGVITTTEGDTSPMSGSNVIEAGRRYYATF